MLSMAERANSLPVWRHFVDGPAAIGGRDGVDPLGPVVGEVFDSVCASLRTQEADHGFRQGAVVVTVAAFRGYRPEGRCQRWVSKLVTQPGPDTTGHVGFLVAGLFQKRFADPIAGAALGQRGIPVSA